MEKQDIPNEQEIEKKTDNIFRLSENVFGWLFSVFLLLSLYFCMIASIYIFAITEGTYSLARIGESILKGLITFSIIFSLVVLTKIAYKSNLIKRLRFQERRSLIKEEIKKEILTEIGRNSKTR